MKSNRNKPPQYIAPGILNFLHGILTGILNFLHSINLQLYSQIHQKINHPKTLTFHESNATLKKTCQASPGDDAF